MSSAGSTTVSITEVAQRSSARSGKQRKTPSIGTTGKAGTRPPSTTLPTSIRRQEPRSKVLFLSQCSPMAIGELPHSNISIYFRPRQRWRGFSFALLQYSQIQAFTACFVPSMQLYHQRNKTAHRYLQVLFLRFAPFYQRRYHTDTIDYNAACATLERITAPKRLQRMPDTAVTPGRFTGQHSRIPCKPGGVAHTVCGSLASDAPGATADVVIVSACTGSARWRFRCFPRPAACDLVLCQRSGCTWSAWHPPPGGAAQRRAARNHWRLPPYLFSGFRPIANK